MHSKTLKRKAAEALELSSFIADWTDPYPVPDFILWRPTKIPRSDRTIGRFHAPPAPPNTPVSSTYPPKTKNKPAPPLEDATFQLSTTERAWLRKTPSLEPKMRRNHKLKADFAKVGAPLKAALAEMAKRTLKKLEEDERWHKEGENQLGHYLIVQALEKKANEKIACMNALSRFKRKESEKRLEYDRKVIEDEYKVCGGSAVDVRWR